MRNHNLLDLFFIVLCALGLAICSWLDAGAQAQPSTYRPQRPTPAATSAAQGVATPEACVWSRTGDPSRWCTGRTSRPDEYRRSAQSEQYIQQRRAPGVATPRPTPTYRWEAR